jgi:hypothetical protein
MSDCPKVTLTKHVIFYDKISGEVVKEYKYDSEYIVKPDGKFEEIEKSARHNYDLVWQTKKWRDT